MQRDIELIKRVLKYVEKKDNGDGRFLLHPEIEGCTPEQVAGHVLLCGEAGYVQLNRDGFALRLTWNGHDKLDQLRSD